MSKHQIQQYPISSSSAAAEMLSTPTLPQLAHAPPGPKLAGMPHVLLLGVSPLTQSIERAFRRIGVICRLGESLSELKDQLGSESRAVFILPPLVQTSAARCARAVRKRSPQLPVFIVMAGAPPARELRRLYRSGVEVVFEWPADKAALTRTAFRLAGASSAPRKAAADVALEELVNDHLRAAPVDLGDALFARVQHRFAILDGQVDALWKVPIAEYIAGQVQGLDDVITRGVQISGRAKSKHSLTKAVEQVIKHSTAEAVNRTLRVDVQDGHVRLTGLAAEPQEMERIVGIVRHVRGVKSVEHHGPAAIRKRQDRQTLRAVLKALNTHHPDARVEPTVFAGIVILSGRVRTAAERRQIETLISGQPGVKRVVEKLGVSKSRRPRS